MKGDRKSVNALKKRVSPLSYEDCRPPFNHDWVEVEAERKPRIGWYLEMRCSKCGTIRTQIVDQFGNVERSGRYKYPDNYLDTDHWSRSQWRINYLRRLNGSK